MRSGMYDVYAMVKVAKLYDNDDTYTEGDESDEDPISGELSGERPRLVATKVVDAYCTCQSGLPGTCNHVCQLLQVVRMLQMTARELRAWDPETVTGRACEWLLKNSKAGRDPKDNAFWSLQLPEIARELRTIRDPKKQKNRSEEPVHTQGVVVGDRSQEFNPHPRGGVWCEQEARFNEGATLRRSKWDKIQNFLAVESLGGERAIHKNLPFCDDTSNELA